MVRNNHAKISPMKPWKIRNRLTTDGQADDRWAGCLFVRVLDIFYIYIYCLLTFLGSFLTFPSLLMVCCIRISSQLNQFASHLRITSVWKRWIDIDGFATNGVLNYGYLIVAVGYLHCSFNHLLANTWYVATKGLPKYPTIVYTSISSMKPKVSENRVFPTRFSNLLLLSGETTHPFWKWHNPTFNGDFDTRLRKR